jgi:hypothetical protein
MATRSRIGIKIGKEIVSVYCHWDGNPSWVGKILKENYDKDKTLALINGGDISSLDKYLSVEEKVLKEGISSDITHTFDNKAEGVTLFYSNRGEVTEPLTHRYKKDFCFSLDNDFAEYGYLFENGEWKYLTPRNQRFIKL